MIGKKNLKKDSKKIDLEDNSKNKVQKEQCSESEKFRNDLLKISKTFKTFSKLNKSFLKNCCSSFEKYINLAQKYSKTKAKFSQEKKRYSKISSVTKRVVQQNTKLRQLLKNAVKIIVSKNQIINRLKGNKADHKCD